jgi:transketolase
MPEGAPNLEALRNVAKEIRLETLNRSYAAGVGHIGSALSIVEIITALWFDAMHAPGLGEPESDRFLLCKGHAALALYVCLSKVGVLSQAALATYCGAGSDICAHPMHSVPGVDLSTGSLGQGLSVACGRALALRRRGSCARVFALMSDGECNEGQVWEAAMFAGHHGLDSVTVVVDLNRSQCMGITQEILRYPDHLGAWHAFGWDAVSLDGHDIAALVKELARAPTGRPRILLANTVLGKGVSFMEGNYRWHYLNLDDDDYAVARREVLDA